MIFWYHFNKNLTKKHGKPMITLHYKNKCHFIEDIECNVKTWAKFNKDQPKFVMKGDANKVVIKKKKAIII